MSSIETWLFVDRMMQRFLYAFKYLSNDSKSPSPGKEDKRIILVPQVNRINSKININVAFVMSSALLIGLIFDKFDFLVLDRISDNFEKIMKSPFPLIIRIDRSIKDDAIEIALPFEILDQFFEINAPSKCLLGEVDIGRI